MHHAHDVVVLSGGLDSTATLARLQAERGLGRALLVTFNYGQTLQTAEHASAEAVARHYALPLRTITLDDMLHGSALTGDQPIPHATYAAEGELPATTVEGRNLLFASIATALAGRGGTVWLGVHADDHFSYPDCRPGFWQHVAAATEAAYGVEVHTPYLTTHKARIVADSTANGAPLGLTWSCYEGGTLHCGTCPSCRTRREAFRLADVPDPTGYADRAQ